MSSITPLDANGRRIPNGSRARPVRYSARWRTPDGKSREKWFRRKVDAEGHLTRVDGSKMTGTYVDASAGEMMVSAYATAWIDTRRTRTGQALSPRTTTLYRQLLATHIAPTLGAVKLRELTPARVRSWHANLHGTTAPAKSYRLVRAVLTTAVRDELILRNPCTVENAGVERAPERPVPTRDEVWALADAIDPRYRALVLLAAFVGLRWSELAALRRADIDLDERTVSVCREAQKSDAARRTVAAAGARS